MSDNLMDSAEVQENLQNNGFTDLQYNAADVVVDDGQVALPDGLDPSLATADKTALLAKLQEMQRTNQELSGRVDPVTAMQTTLQQTLAPFAPKAADPIDGSKWVAPQSPQVPYESQEQFQKRMSDKFLMDPVGAQQELLDRQLGPLVGTFLQNQAQTSRELLRLNPKTAKIYEKYSNEIEREVSMIPPNQRLQNPNIYQQAAEIVRGRHLSEEVNESVAEQVKLQVAEQLKAMGLDPSGVKPGQPVQQQRLNTLANPAGSQPQQQQNRNQIRLTPQRKAELERLADVKGMDFTTMVNIMHENGQL